MPKRRRLLRGLAGTSGALLLWEAAVRAGLVDGRFLPPPSAVIRTLVTLVGDVSFRRDVVASVLAWVIALGIAIVVAAPVGVLLGSVPGLRVATRAIVELLRPIPSVALIPLVILVVGGGPEAKIALAVYASVWPILFNAVYALGEIDPLLVDTARACGAGRVRILATVAVPHAAPFVFTGIRLSAAIALIVVVSTEYLAGASIGIGTFILTASSGGGRMDLVLAGALTAGVIGCLVNEGLAAAGRRWLRWSPLGGAAV